MSEHLTATLAVSPSEAGYELTLSVENEGSEPVELTFSDGQRAEFIALADGEAVWRWSEGRAFAMALGGETLAPGESVSYEGTWPDPAPGEYEVRGRLAARNADAEASMTVVVPE